MKYFLGILILGVVLFGNAGSTFATHTGNPDDHGQLGTSGTGAPLGTSGGGAPLGTSKPASQIIGIPNPIAADNITELFKAIIDILLVFAVPLIVFFILYAGFSYVTARGNAEKITKAHMALLYALIGGVLILGAEVLITVIQGTVDGFR